MHKVFAKTLFLGKNVIFLPQCHSTNDLMRKLAKQRGIVEGSVVWTDFQEKGRGRQGNTWISEAEKNLLFTVFLRPRDVPIKNQFRISMLASLALKEVLEKWVKGKIEIKWPNDIYVNDRKVGGILLESSSRDSNIEEVFVGIGLNVNQSHFSLPTATSMNIETSQNFDRSQILEEILLNIEKYYDDLPHNRQLESIYVDSLRWKNEEHTYRIGKEMKKGTIIGISTYGRIKILIGGLEQEFDMNEIEFIE